MPSNFLFALAVAMLSGNASIAQSPSPVAIEQIPSGPGTRSSTREAIGRPAASPDQRQGEVQRSSAVDTIGTPLSEETVQACRNAEVGGAPPEGVNCVAVLQTAEEAAAEVTAEGALLELLGQRGTMLEPAARRTEAFNADAVARQLSTDNVQDLTAGGAAGIAARQRPTQGPR
jgi:hypothetical protein